MTARLPGEVFRRPSYGPSSPNVGERGARTRGAIVDATLEQFAAKGFHGTLIDDIATAAGISRAALYQYFESKEQLFIELLRESGADLLRVVRRLGPLGPTVEGFDNLHWWLGEWAWVQDKYSTMFVQWANVDSPRAPLRPLIADFVGAYTTRMSQRIATADLDALDPEDTSVALLAVMIRVNYYRHTRLTRGVSDEVMLDTLSRVFQMILYPSTPPEALLVPASTGSGLTAVKQRPAARESRVVQVRPAQPRGLHWQDRFRGRSDRARRTARRLLDAGAAVFADHGFHRSSVDEILKEAGVGRGTFYKYFSDKLDLLITLAEECARRLQELIERFAAIDLQADPQALRAWLEDFIAFHRLYAGVFRVWTEREPRDEALAEIGREVSATILVTFDQVLDRVKRPYPFDLHAGSLVLLALLERVPDYAAHTEYETSTEDLVEVMAAFIERGLLNGERRGRQVRRRAASR